MKNNLISDDEEEPNSKENQKYSRNTLGEIFHDDPEDFSEWQNKSCCSKCCHYLFCCCCCVTYEKSKTSFKRGWSKFLTNEESNDSADKPFQMLTKLFINEENAIEGLKNIRLNPNLVSANKLRNDLEFYIPQLCTFLLFGGVKEIEEFFVFLCKVCNISFFFAHRVHWFLSAMINSAQDKKDDVINILKMVNTLFKSEDKKLRKKINKFYLTNSEKFIDYIKKNELYFLYDNNITENENIFEKIEFNSLNMIQQQIYNRYKNSRQNIIDFSNNEYNTEKQKEINKLKESGKFKNNENIINTNNNDINNEEDNNNIIKTNSFKKNIKLKPDEFFIDISNFKLNNPDVTQQDEDDLFEFEENINYNDEELKNKDENDTKKIDLLYNEKNTIDTNDFINFEKKEKDINFISYHSTLNFIDHLCDISNDLPKHPIEEQKIFLFKKLNEINQKLPCNVYLPFLKNSTRNYLVCHIPIEGVKIFRTKTRCPIMLTFELVRIDEINQEITKDDMKDLDNDNNRMTLSPNIIRKNNGFGDNKLLIDIIKEENDDYKDTDYNLSKPLMINYNNDNNYINNNNKEKNSKKDKDKDKNIIPENKNKDNNDTTDIEDRKFIKIVNKFKNQNKLILYGRKNSNTIYRRNAPSLEDIDIIDEENNKNNIINTKDQIKIIPEVNEIKDIIHTNSNTSISSTSTNEEKLEIKKSLNYEDFINIFGETFYEKEKNIKSKSLFGNFKTYKIFRCIFKTHEDLRQEQFATQLINEFNQIFKLENVDCWLNDYEIISTGNDSGLVEMVNDSLSLDQLKQKINNISLSDFYLYYWGKGHTDTPEYKNAMKNYVESLAGYSLVCYFLQIKDRHNGNILIDNEGHLTHIDFGFLLSNAPGKGLKFENAPFKLSKDMVQNLGGIKGQYFEQFRKLLKKGFLAVHKHREKIIILVEMMWCGNGRNLDCFEKGQEAIDNLRLRLAPKNCDNKIDIFKFVDSLIEQSVDNWRTNWYDIFQYYVQGIFY